MKQLPAPVYAEYGRVGYGIIVQGIPTNQKSVYRVSEGKVFFLIGLWEKEIYKLDYIWR